jgi:CubicO group peptidase (beta-lactamase class C family)/polyisoprenoid-binding protein YceI
MTSPSQPARFLAVTSLLLLATHTASAAPKVFDFNDPKGTNAISLGIDALLEPVVGYADGITGTANFDPEKPQETTGKITVAVSSVKFSHPGYTNSVQGYGLGRDKTPTITCELKKILSGKAIDKGHYKGMVQVDFTIKGVTKALTIPLDVNYIPGRAYERDSKTDGDLMVVRSKFMISRKMFGVAQEVPIDMAGDGVEIGIAIVGTSGKLRFKAKEAPKETPKEKEAELMLVSGDKKASITERMAFHKISGCTVAFIKDFKIDSFRYYGNTGNEAKTPIDPKTLFPAGQMSGVVSATLALRLAQEKIVDLDADINTYLKNWKVPENKYTKDHPVTLRHLLTNKSGFRFHKYMGYDPKKPLPTITQVLKAYYPSTTPPAEVVSEPGKVFYIASENLTVLQQVLEDATGKSWQALLTQTFGPKESRAMVFPPSETYTQYAKGFEENGTPVPHGGRAYPELAAAGLWASVPEFADLAVALLSANAGKGETILNGEMAKTFFAPTVQKTSSEDGQTMAFGINADPKNPFLFRGGSTQGYYCQMWLNPEKGDAVIFFANRQLCWQFGNEIRDTFVKDWAK